MTAHPPVVSSQDVPSCRASFDAPCVIERRLREALAGESLRLATVLHDDLGNQLFGAAFCLAAVRSRVTAVDPALGERLDEVTRQLTDAAALGLRSACSVSDFVATHHGLAAALQIRFGRLRPAAEPACELVLQHDADRGLSADEHRVLLRIAEEAVGQVTREGASGVRVLLRRSRLGPVELSVAGEGEARFPHEVAASYRSLARVRKLAAEIDARLNVRRLDAGGLFIRCSTRWVEGEAQPWADGR